MEPVQEFKPFYKSKTFVFNAGVALLTFVSTNSDAILQGVSPGSVGKVAMGIAIVNLILRGMTTKEIKF